MYYTPFSCADGRIWFADFSVQFPTFDTFFSFRTITFHCCSYVRQQGAPVFKLPCAAHIKTATQRSHDQNITDSSAVRSPGTLYFLCDEKQKHNLCTRWSQSSETTWQMSSYGNPRLSRPGWRGGRWSKWWTDVMTRKKTTALVREIWQLLSFNVNVESGFKLQIYIISSDS